MDPNLTLQPRTQTLEHVINSDPALVRGFANGVFDMLANGPLTLQDRDRLLKRAVRMGIKRFDANLVIAAMEHRRRGQPVMRLAAQDESVNETESTSWLPWAAALAVQASIAFGAWWLLFT